jgi:hypothetical protein
MIVPARLVTEDTEQIRLIESVSTHLHCTPCPLGWQMGVILERGEYRAEAVFRPILVGPSHPVQFTPIELLYCVDNVIALLRWAKQDFEAVFSTASLQGLVRFLQAEPRGNQPIRHSAHVH